MEFLKRLGFGTALKIIGAVGASALLAGCGSDGGSGKFDLDDSFEIVLDKAEYDYRSKDSLLVVRKPVCQETKMGYLEWKEESQDADSIEAYEKNGKAYIRPKGNKEWSEFKFEGKNFPKGLIYDVADAKESIRYATRIDKKIKSVLQYDGNCFMKSYYGNAFGKGSAVKGVDKALKAFYGKFRSDEFDEDEIIDDARVPDCDEMTLFGGDVVIALDYLKESSGKIVLEYENAESCPITFNIRYAIDEEDCAAAYDDYEKSRSKDDFDFDDYAVSTEYSSYCIESLVLRFKKDKGVLTKRAAVEQVSAEQQASEVARSAVNLLLSGLKR